MQAPAVYVRISKDRAGVGLGVSRQEEGCATLCRRRRWQIVRVYVDNDVSAYSGKPRPAWKELLADIRAGRIDAIVCWHVDRLTCSPRELEDVIDVPAPFCVGSLSRDCGGQDGSDRTRLLACLGKL